MDFKTKRKYKKLSKIYTAIFIVFAVLFSLLLIVGFIKNSYYITIFSSILIVLNLNITTRLIKKYKNKRIEYLKNIKLYRQYNFLHIIIHEIRKNDFVTANKYGHCFDNNEELNIIIYTFLMNELLHSSHLFLSKLGEDYLKDFLDKYNKNDIFK